LAKREGAPLNSDLRPTMVRPADNGRERERERERGQKIAAASQKSFQLVITMIIIGEARRNGTFVPGVGAVASRSLAQTFCSANSVCIEIMFKSESDKNTLRRPRKTL
jgi:hypothetical protein